MDIYELTEEAGTYRFALSGRLTYHDHDEMKEFVHHFIRSRAKRIVVDLDKVTFIDSSAVGMLLILAEEMRNINGTISLQNSQGQVDRVLTTAKINDLLLTPHYTCSGPQ